SRHPTLPLFPYTTLFRSLPVKPDEPPAGAIRNVIVRNVIAHGKGACLINGHPDSWLDHVSLENIKLYLSTDPSAAYDRSVNAMRSEEHTSELQSRFDLVC